MASTVDRLKKIIADNFDLDHAPDDQAVRVRRNNPFV